MHLLMESLWRHGGDELMFGIYPVQKDLRGWLKYDEQIIIHTTYSVHTLK